MNTITIEGPPGSGKTTLALEIAATLTAKGKLVMLMNSEDYPANLRERFEQAGGNSERMYIGYDESAVKQFKGDVVIRETYPVAV